MQSITINIKNKNLTEKILWILEYFKKDALEIVKKKDFDDLKLLEITRDEETISFDKYLKKNK